MKSDMVDMNEGEAVSHDETSLRPDGETRKKKGPPLVSLDAAILGDVDVRLSAILGHGSIAVRDLLELEDGSVLNLDTPLDGMIDVTLNGRIVARGEIVAVGDKFGVRIAKIVAERE
jgi:flagellar motor switch protein FliN/FliY